MSGKKLSAKSISINKDIQADIKLLVNAMNDAQVKLNIICKGYISGRGEEGSYELSKDLKSLKLVEDKKE